MFKLGDRVYSNLFGVGIVKKISNERNYPLLVEFNKPFSDYDPKMNDYIVLNSESDILHWFTLEGQYIKENHVHFVPAPISDRIVNSGIVPLQFKTSKAIGE